MKFRIQLLGRALVTFQVLRTHRGLRSGTELIAICTAEISFEQCCSRDCERGNRDEIIKPVTHYSWDARYKGATRSAAGTHPRSQRGAWWSPSCMGVRKDSEEEGGTKGRVWPWLGSPWTCPGVMGDLAPSTWLSINQELGENLLSKFS